MDRHKKPIPSRRAYPNYWELHASLVKLGAIKKSSRPKYLRMVMMYDNYIYDCEARAYGYRFSPPPVYYIKKYGTYYDY